MPASWSMICTVPGGNVGPVGVGVAGDSAVVGGLDERPTTSPMTTRTATTPATTAHTHRGRLRRGDGSEARDPVDVRLGGGGGARTGDDCTMTPGPAGVATSDQLTPFHQRTMPGAPSGSGYQPGAGAGPPSR